MADRNLTLPNHVYQIENCSGLAVKIWVGCEKLWRDDVSDKFDGTAIREIGMVRSTLVLLVFLPMLVQSVQAGTDIETCKSLHPRMKVKDLEARGLIADFNQRRINFLSPDGAGCTIGMSDDRREIEEITVIEDRDRQTEPEVRKYATSLIRKLIEKWGLPTSMTMPYYYNAMDKVTGGVNWTCSGAYRDGSLHQVYFDVHGDKIRTTIHSHPCLGSKINEYDD